MSNYYEFEAIKSLIDMSPELFRRAITRFHTLGDVGIASETTDFICPEFCVTTIVIVHDRSNTSRVNNFLEIDIDS